MSCIRMCKVEILESAKLEFLPSFILKTFFRLQSQNLYPTCSLVGVCTHIVYPLNDKYEHQAGQAETKNIHARDTPECTVH